MPKVEIPSWEEFMAYWIEIFKNKDDNPHLYTEWLEDKYESWKLNGWKKEVGGKPKPILNWKSTLRQCAPYRRRNKNIDTVKQTVRPLKETGKSKEIDDSYIVDAWNYFYRENHLLPKHEEAFDILYKRGVFRNGKETSKKTGKPWQEWYNSLTTIAGGFRIAYCHDNNLSNEKKKELMPVFIKLEALKTYLRRYRTAFELKQSL